MSSDQEQKWINYIKEYSIEESDTELAHIEADKALCLFLTELGYTKIVEAWEERKPKFYA